MEWDRATVRGVAANIKGFLRENEGLKLAELASGKFVIEVGCFCGRSTNFMAQTAARVLSVDWFRANNDVEQGCSHTMPNLYVPTVVEYLHNVSKFVNVQTMISDSVSGALLIKDNSADMIFLDAGHEYEEVKSDLLSWWPKLKAGGIWSVHDYSHVNYPGVKMALTEFLMMAGQPQSFEHESTLAWGAKK